MDKTLVAENPVPAGLTSAQAAQRLRESGRNELAPPTRHVGFVALALRVIADPMVLLLVVAGVAYLVFGDRFDAIVIAIALLPIVAVSAILEQRADNALERLRALAAPTATVVRDGEERHISALEVVLGDVLVLHEGDIAAATANSLRAAGFGSMSRR
jgi:Ca2+-transporting ATPase